MEKFLTWNLVTVTRLVRFGTVGAVRTLTTVNHKEIFNRGSTDFSLGLYGSKTGNFCFPVLGHT